jgi:Ca2+-binding RTX toxin-like protein
MKSNKFRAAPLTSLAGGLLLLAGAVLAGGNSPHNGDPSRWGPGLEELCESPMDAAVAGYHVINDPDPDSDGTFGGLLEGTSGADVIFANGGNDDVRAGRGDDVICGSAGHDTLHGEGGNDAIFGQAHNDMVKGGGGRDYVSGGSQIDSCDGGSGADAADIDCASLAP